MLPLAKTSRTKVCSMTRNMYNSYFYLAGNIHLFEAMQSSIQQSLPVCKNTYAATETEAYLRHVYTDSNVLTTSCEDEKKKGTSQREREREGTRRCRC